MLVSLFYTGCNSTKKTQDQKNLSVNAVNNTDVCKPLMSKLNKVSEGTDPSLLEMLKKNKDACLKGVEQVFFNKADKHNHKNAVLKKNAINLLSLLVAESSINSFVAAIDDRNPQVVSTALMSLQKYSLKQLQNAILTMLKHEDFKVRIAAIDIVKSKKDIKSIPLLIDALKDKHGGVRNAVYAAIASLGKPAVDALIKEFNNKNSNIDKNIIIVALGRTKDVAVVDLILNVMKSDDIKLKNAAVCALADISDARTVQPLTEALSDPNPPVRACAAKALGNQGDLSVAGDLIKLLTSDKYDQVKAMSAYALGKLGDPKSINPLIKGLKSESKVLRYHSIAALSNFKTATAANALASSLGDPEVRIFAISSLVKLEQTSVPVMIKSLKNSNDLVAAGAAAVLGRIGDKSAVKPLIKVLSRKDVEKQAAAALKIITHQNFGNEINAWIQWAKNNS